MQPLRIRFSIDNLYKDIAFYTINLSEYNVDDVKYVYVDGRNVGFYYDNTIKELRIAHNIIDLFIIQDNSIYIDFYSVMENRNLQLEKLGI
jgi:hypothetical protein